jgi:RsiW-degrading membrane proteinase PrsW (M82 family)
VFNLVVVILSLYVLIVAMCPGEYRFVATICYLCCWTPSFLLLTYAWWRVGKRNGVHLGLLANFVMQGGIMGTSFALVLNTTLIASWSNLSPACNPMEITMTLSCNIAAASMWILTPGLVEETFKAVWLFFRLRRSVDDVPATCCFCLPASRSFNCGCWYKLAPSPYHVVLCAIASGAGFECMENVLYVFQKSGVLARAPAGATSTTTTTTVPDPNVPALPTTDPMMLMLITAIGRMPFSMVHMVWTGLIGLGLARRMFLSGSRRPSLPLIILPSMIAHGVSDYALSAMGAAANSGDGGLAYLFFPLARFASVGSCCLIGRQTGCRGVCGCADRCCFAPGFWQDMFGIDGLPARAADASSDSRGDSLVGPPISATSAVNASMDQQHVVAPRATYEMHRQAQDPPATQLSHVPSRESGQN